MSSLDTSVPTAGATGASLPSATACSPATSFGLGIAATDFDSDPVDLDLTSLAPLFATAAGFMATCFEAAGAVAGAVAGATGAAGAAGAAAGAVAGAVAGAAAATAVPLSVVVVFPSESLVSSSSADPSSAIGMHIAKPTTPKINKMFLRFI